MLKRLQKRFVLINMLYVGVALALIFTAVMVIGYRSERARIESALDGVLQRMERQHPPMQPGETLPTDPPAPEGELRPQIGAEPLPYVFAFAVVVNEAGEILNESGVGADMSDALLQNAVAEALQQGEGTTRLPGLGLICCRRNGARGEIKLAFTSDEYLLERVWDTALVGGVACLFAMLLFYVLCRILAGHVVRPIDEAFRSQRQFVADASHDLRTPLTVILSNMEVLRRHGAETVESQLKWVESTREEAERMRGLTEGMLELARSERAEESVELTDTPVSDLVEETLLQLEPVAFDKGVSLTGEIAPGLRLRSHGDSLVRLLHILLDNAVKYSPKGGEVRLILAPEGRGCRLSVHNGGQPIPAEDLPHIFKRFYRADKARGAGGFGLGLSIAENLATALGGRIEVKSTAEEGTTFTVLLP
ncbi:MAG: HAMP domain-containing histidine kinase [Ruminococcaceae bacterium]|nr:HAMP domain-containing histidine kinase [Oscillospiraceae bacterium]